MVAFLVRTGEDPEYWFQISRQSLERIQSSYTWELYASKLLSLSRIYGFWRFISQMERQETRRYLEMFFGLVYRPLAQGHEPAALSS
jgi:sucrose synthase